MTTEIYADAQEAQRIKSKADMATKEEAMQYAKDNNIRSMRAWFAHHNIYTGGRLRPQHIPGDPAKFYGLRGQWEGWSEFLGTNNRSTMAMKDDFSNFNECKKWFHDNKIYTVSAFRELCKSGEKPDFIPSAPDKAYNVKYSALLCPKESKFVTFEEAKALIKDYGIRHYLDFRAIRNKEIDKLSVIPCNPDKVYQRTGEWNGWPDFLGYEPLRVRTKKHNIKKD